MVSEIPFEEKIKEMYNRDNISKYGQDYEFKRWLSNENAKTDYAMTYRAIEFGIKDIKFNSCLELGPGPGTWTKLILNKKDNTKIVLLDISKEMLKQAKNNLSRYKNAIYKEINFLNYESKDNLIFSFLQERLNISLIKKKLVKL